MLLWEPALTLWPDARSGYAACAAAGVGGGRDQFSEPSSASRGALVVKAAGLRATKAQIYLYQSSHWITNAGGDRHCAAEARRIEND